MKKTLIAILSISFLLATGCASTQMDVPLAGTSLVQGEKVGVYIDELPQVTTQFPGAGCLLCLAAASATHGDLTKYVKTLTAEDLTNVSATIGGTLKEKGVTPVIIEEKIEINKLPKLRANKELLNRAQRDFSSVVPELDKIIVIDINAMGVHRNYSSYIPTGDPQAVVQGVAYMIDLKSNTYEWYSPVSVYRSAEGEWKEKPSYPGLTNAFYQAIESAKDFIVQPFLLE